MPTSRSVQKAVILAGGTGGRLTDLTRGKINKVNIIINGKPLIAYQLEALQAEGIKEVALVIRPDHEGEFREAIRAGRYPPLHYRIIHTPFQESGYATSYMLPRVLNSPEIHQFVGKDLVFIGYGDTFYFSSYLKRAFARFRQRKMPIVLSDPIVSVTEDKVQPELTVSTASGWDNRISPAICGMIADPPFVEHTFRHISKAHRMMDLLALAERSGRPSEIMTGPTINLNHPINYIAIREVLLGKLRFPFPKGWTRQYKEEVEEIMQRRFLPREHKDNRSVNRKRRRYTRHHK